MKNIISWARTTIQKLPVPTNQEQLKTQNRVVLFASLSILQDLKGKTDNLPEGPEHAVVLVTTGYQPYFATTALNGLNIQVF